MNSELLRSINIVTGCFGRSMSPPRSWSTALLLSVAFLTTGARAASKSDYDNLLKVLFQNYSRDVRPVNDFDTTTVIYLALHLLAIIEVSCRRMR